MKRALLYVLPALLLFSCGEPASSSSSEEVISSEVTSVTSVEPSSEATTSKRTYHDGIYHFYCVNDFHGSVLERQSTYYEPGIAKCFGKLRSFKNADPDHTFIFSAGDMFQGSLESNDNYGFLVTDCMNDLPFDAMCLGNHEFDYGQQRLKDIVARAEFPVLGGNVRKWENGAATSELWYDGIKASTVIERCGLKVGVVGMIGHGQTTSISSQNVSDLDFVDPENPALLEALNLRKAGCDVVIFLAHDTYKKVNFAAKKDYFDGVFTGHNHSREEKLINGVPFVQAYCNGEAISHFDLKIEQGVITCSEYGIINASDSWADDEAIVEIRDSYLNEGFQAKAERPAGTVTGTLEKGEGVPNIFCKAAFEKYQETYPDLALAMCNSQRAPLMGDITYSDIYKATPFTNCTIIADVKGSDILQEGKYNATYTGDVETYGTIASDKVYRIACTDYVLCHQNVKKVYDYFPSLNHNGGGSIIEIYEDYPFDLVFDYCVDTLDGVIHAEDFANTAHGFGLYD